MLMDIPIDQFTKRVSLFQSGCQFSPITKGFSADVKYRVRTSSGAQYLLRVVSANKFLRTQVEYHLIQQMFETGITVPRPVVLGRWDDLNVGFYVLSFIEGQDAEDALMYYSADAQWQIGVRAGRDLYRMHQFPAPPYTTPWGDHILKKCSASIDAYRLCGNPVHGADQIITFIERSAPILRQRPNRFQHDDFHVANIIVHGGQYAGVIDFNRCDWGDPIHDFLKIAFFSRPVSVPFCLGQLAGYFGKQPISDEFWHLYSVYVAMSIFASVVWTMRVAPETMGSMMARIDRVLEDHRGFESIRPAWFREI